MAEHYGFFSLKLGLVWVNPGILVRSFHRVVCKVSADHITVFICPFSPETFPKAFFFQSLIGFLSVWWPQPSAPKRENRSRLKPKLQKTVALCWHTPSSLLASQVSFSVTKLWRSFEQTATSSSEAEDFSWQSKQASLSTQSSASSASGNLWQCNWLHFLSWRLQVINNLSSSCQPKIQDCKISGNWLETNWVAIWGLKLCKARCSFCWIRHLNSKCTSSHLFGLTREMFLPQKDKKESHYDFNTACKEVIVKRIILSALGKRLYIISRLQRLWEFVCPHCRNVCDASSGNHLSLLTLHKSSSPCLVDAEMLVHRQALWGHLVVWKHEKVQDSDGLFVQHVQPWFKVTP